MAKHYLRISKPKLGTANRWIRMNRLLPCERLYFSLLSCDSRNLCRWKRNKPSKCSILNGAGEFVAETECSVLTSA